MSVLVLHSVAVQNHSLPPGSSSLVLTGLTPGALYRLQAATVSGELRSKPTSLKARTGKTSELCPEGLNGFLQNLIVPRTRQQTIGII